MGRSEAETGGIRVVVKADYWPDRSQPQAGRFAFAYRVSIENRGTEAATLQTRHWLITDAAGRVEEVRGEGREAEGRAARPGGGERERVLAGVPVQPRKHSDVGLAGRKEPVAL